MPRLPSRRAPRRARRAFQPGSHRAPSCRSSPRSTASVDASAGGGSSPPGPASCSSSSWGSPASSAGPAGPVLPTPDTTDAVLLVGNPAALSAGETQWLADLRANLGRVDALAYGDASLERLRAYFVVFVIDQSPDLDVTALSAAYHAGMTVHLVGPASSYRDRVAAAVVTP